ncbi:MAG: NAD-dependent malic enzyme [bacterium]|nr:NAD-dependent malic enzyme [bacterium]
MDTQKESLKMHIEQQGKLEVKSKVPLETKEDLSLAYTPGVAEPCREIAKNKDDVYKYTFKGNMVAIVTDGSAVLGLGNIGPEAGLPVMEGKALLFKELAGVDAFPICLATQDVEEIIDAVKKIAPTFGGINLEDISAPRCFEVEKRLKEELDIPVFHDDQHGTAVVTLAGMINALKVTGKKKEDLKIVVSGVGAAGVAVIKLLLHFGVKDVIMLDTKGALYEGRTENMNPVKEEMAKITNKDKFSGNLAEAVKGRDVFIGVSAPNVLTKEMVETMDNPIIFAMANPDPEIMPDDARAAGAAVIATGRSDFPNQVNNAVGFPGIFRGAFDVRASDINNEMNVAAAYALASMVENPSADKIIPAALDRSVAPVVAKAVAEAAKKSGVARI